MRKAWIDSDRASRRRGRRAARCGDRSAAAAPSVDLTKLTIPILAVNGSFDNPYRKTHRLWREVQTFQNVILPGKTHLTAIAAGAAPSQQYIDVIAKFIDVYDRMSQVSYSSKWPVSSRVAGNQLWNWNWKPLSNYRIVRHVDQPIAGSHIFFEQREERRRDRAGLAVADRVVVPLHDAGDLHRAADQQHLLRGERVLHA